MEDIRTYRIEEEKTEEEQKLECMPATSTGPLRRMQYAITFFGFLPGFSPPTTDR